jgi:hypothetical protein
MAAGANPPPAESEAHAFFDYTYIRDSKLDTLAFNYYWPNDGKLTVPKFLSRHEIRATSVPKYSVKFGKLAR